MHNSGEGGSYDLKDRNWAQGEECGGHRGGRTNSCGYTRSPGRIGGGCGSRGGATRRLRDGRRGRKEGGGRRL